MSYWNLPHASRRQPVIAENMVAASQPLAAQAGLHMLLNGGNAVDAALAAALTLTVVEPTGCGVGGDAFALVWDGAELHGLNGSGRSPAAWGNGHFHRADQMPDTGWDTVTVPGAVSAWVELWHRFGSLDFPALFEPAVFYAENGFAVTPVIAARWRESAEALSDYPAFSETFLPGGRPPEAGEHFRCPDLAATLTEIAATCGESFYRGRLAEAIARSAREQGGALTGADLAAHEPLWVEPVSLMYRGHEIHELPPNGQGIAVLQGLGLLEHFEMDRYPPDSVESVHLQVEAMKLAYADLFAHLADPSAMTVGVAALLDPAYLRRRAGLIDRAAARFPSSGILAEPGTVYLSAADATGLMVSFIQSNYHGFGSGIVVPGTGISLHNRGSGFTLEEGHPNQVDGNKRPLHTIIPAFVTAGGRPVLSFGIMGAHMQAQGQVQLLTRLIDHGQNPQAASDAPRWHVAPDGTLAVEPGIPAATVAALRALGHGVDTGEPMKLFGGAQLIQCRDGCYVGGSDHRKDGQAVGF